MGDVQHSSLVDDPRSVDVALIERELTSLWKEAGTLDDDGLPVVRACSLNLLVLTDNERQASELDSVLAEIAIAHPCRIFLVTAENETDSPLLEAWVSARCSIPLPGEKQVCCEQVNLSARGADVSKVPSVITSLLVPDVPVVLFWKSGMSHPGNMVDALVGVSDHLITDSRHDRAPLPGFVKFEMLIADREGRTTCGDLAWSRLGPWRRILGDFFEPGEMRGHLRKLNRLEIEYSTDPASMQSGLSAAMLLTGWFGHSLGWCIERLITENSGGEYRAIFRLGDKKIIVDIRESSRSESSAGCMETVVLEAPANFRLTIEATEHREWFRLQGRGGAGVEDLHVRNPDDVELLVRELENPFTDQTYRSSLRPVVGAMKEEI